MLTQRDAEALRGRAPVGESGGLLLSAAQLCSPRVYGRVALHKSDTQGRQALRLRLQVMELTALLRVWLRLELLKAGAVCSLREAEPRSLET